MNFLLTGGNGFIGQHLTRDLAWTGNGGHLLTRTPPDNPPPGFTWLEWHAGKRIVLPPDNESACLIHLAARHHVPRPTAGDLESFRAINVEGTRQLLLDASRAGIRRLVFFSTIKAAGTPEPDREPGPRRESDPECGPPDSPYGQSKREAERAVEEWARETSNRAALILRPAVVYGPGNTANIHALARAIHRGRFFLVGRNENVKSMISVTNVMAAVRHLISRMQPGCETYYLTDAESVPVRELAFRLARLLKTPQPRELPPFLLRWAARAGDGMQALGIQSPLDSARLKALGETSWFACDKLLAAGFRHPQTLDQGLEAMIGGYRDAAGATNGKAPD